MKRSKLQLTTLGRQAQQRFLPSCFSKAIRTASWKTRREVLLSSDCQADSNAWLIQITSRPRKDKKMNKRRKETMRQFVRDARFACVLCITGLCQIAFGGVWYVDATSGDDANSGTSAALAFASIQRAIDSAAWGDKVIVNDGVYGAITATNLLLTIESVNGPEKTAIDGAQSACAADLDSVGTSGSAPTNTLLRGFTVRNGSAYVGGGIYGGTAENCVISNNTAQAYGGGTIQTVCRDCLVVGNSAGQYGGGTAYGDVWRCVITKNTAFCGGGTYKSPTHNSLITFNTVTGGGGGSYQNSLYHCTVYGNAADQGGGIYSGNVINCIFAGNSANAGMDTYSATMTYSCATDNVNLLGDGEGNISDDPCFVEAATGDFHLSENSPCINTGSSDESVLSEWFDIEGNARICDGRTDMGAYEYQPVPDATYADIWGTWSTDGSEPYIMPESVSSWDELSRVLWRARDAYVKSGARTEVPPSAGSIILSLGAVSVPDSLMTLETSIETEVEHGVPVWRLRVFEDTDARAIVAVAGKCAFELSSLPSYLANGWVNAVYGQPPAWLGADETDAWYAARSRSRIEWFVTLVPQSQWATYCANRAIEASNASSNNESPLVINAVVSDSETGIHSVSVRSLTDGETRIWGKDSLSETNWTYKGLSLQSAGTTAAGAHSISNQLFMMATFSETSLDSDGDGVPDIMEEKVYGTNPYRADSSGEGLSDWEKVYRYDLNPRVRDTSGDGIDDDEKIFSGADPRVAVSAAEQEKARMSIRYYYDDDDRLVGTWFGRSEGSTKTLLSPAGNPREINSRDATMGSPDSPPQPPVVVVPTGLTISGADSVESGEHSAYTCTVTRSDGTGGVVSPTWELINGSNYASLNSSGVLSANAIDSPQSVTIRASYTQNGRTVTATKTVTITVATVADTITVSFSGNTGSSYQDFLFTLNNPDCTARQCVSGETYGSLPTPTLSGATFAGWWTDASGGTQVTENSIVPSTNITLYAHWSADITITFDGNGGTPSESSKVYAANTVYGLLPTATCSGQEFAGWWTDANGGSQITESSIVPAANTTLFAHWTPITPVVTVQPPSLTISASPTEVSATWTSSANAVRYELYRGTDADFSHATKIVSVDGLTYKDSPELAGNTAYYYWVKAIASSAESNESNVSHVHTYQTAGAYALTLPAGDHEVVLVGGGGGGAQCAQSSMLGFYIAGGGAGAHYKGVLRLPSGGYTVTVGNGGAAGVANYSFAATAANGGETKLTGPGSVVYVSAGGGVGGRVTGASGTGGGGGTVSIGSTTTVVSTTSNTSGNSGNGGWNVSIGSASGGASVYGGYGWGGANTANGGPGFFQITINQ